MHFGLRGCHEHLQLKWGDAELKQDENGEYLEFNERSTKTRQETAKNNVRPFHPKMFATGSFKLKLIPHLSRDMIHYHFPYKLLYPMIADLKISYPEKADLR